MKIILLFVWFYCHSFLSRRFFDHSLIGNGYGYGGGYPPGALGAYGMGGMYPGALGMGGMYPGALGMGGMYPGALGMGGLGGYGMGMYPGATEALEWAIQELWGSTAA